MRPTFRQWHTPNDDGTVTFHEPGEVGDYSNVPDLAHLIAEGSVGDEIIAPTEEVSANDSAVDASIRRIRERRDQEPGIAQEGSHADAG